MFDSTHGRWRLLGAAEADGPRTSAEREAILDALEEADELLGPKDIAATTGMDYGNVRSLLSSMVAAHEVERLTRGR